MFSLDDRSIQYPHAAVQRVSSFMNFIYAGIVPLVVILLWMLLSRPGWHKSHVSVLGLLISHALSSFLTDVIKNAIGRPRPDLIARCKPEPGTAEHALITFSVCTETDPHTLQDGWRSFPSGHSSFAFAGLGYLSLLFAGQMHVFRPRTDLARVIIALTPLLGAALIAMSRMADYRHDVYDVTSGSILGMLMAYFSYRRYYPSLWRPRCDEPYPSRGSEMNRVLLKSGNQGRDEEDRLEGAAEFELEDLVDEDEDISQENHTQNSSNKAPPRQFPRQGSIPGKQNNAHS